MNIVGIVIAVLFIITISNFVFKKFNILIDQTNISTHKSFVNGHKTAPLLGGFVFFLILVFFLPENYQYFTILIFFIFLTGLLSDLDILHSPFLRIIFQTIIIVVYLFLFDNFVSSIRVDFFDNLLNIFFIKLFFTSFCILVLINGTNFIDGVNTLVVGYFILVASNVLYLAEVNNLDLDIPLVLDADGLNNICRVQRWWEYLPSNTVLTPHPGEMARLSGVPVVSIQKDKIGFTQARADCWNRIVILKGAHTIISAPNLNTSVSPFANPAMSSGGTGDVLAGIIAALISQGLSGSLAASCGVYVHGQAGAFAADQLGDTGLTATDITNELPKIIKSLRGTAYAADVL